MQNVYNIGDKLGNKVCVGKIKVNPTLINDETEYLYVWEEAKGATGGSGGVDYLGKFADGTLSDYTNDDVTIIREKAFQYCNLITSVTFNACKAVGYSAFQGCYSLTTVTIPEGMDCDDLDDVLLGHIQIIRE